MLRLLRGESVDALSRELAVPIFRLKAWRDRALAGIDVGLKERDQAEGRRTAVRLVPSAARDAAKPHRTIRSSSS
ncbi:MAG TPA: hypothetical protein PKC22_13365 [Rhodocyclaceae bacterium]|nr:hypothetical protein [Rhodocyclaceae bacterium]